MRSIRVLALAICVALPKFAFAASLQVSPVSFDLPASSFATQLTLRNLGEESIDVQIRVYQWSQEDGQEVLTPTTDVVASPPATTLEAGQNHVVRLVRTSNAPVTGEESYRLIIDELPQQRGGQSMAVNFVVRYSMPIFFSENGTRSELSWQSYVDGDNLVVRAQNTGTRHAQLSELQLTNTEGERLTLASNLAGYVLPESSMQWSAPLPEGEVLAPGAGLAISARGKDGEVHAIVTVQGAAN